MATKKKTEDAVNFEYDKWEAATLADIFEIEKMWLDGGFHLKKVDHIKIIGTGDPGLWNGCSRERLERLGYWGRRDEWVHYYDEPDPDFLKDAQVKRKVFIEEPVQFIFEDGSSFEICLLGGEIRAGINSIPLDVTEGEYPNNINTEFLFAPLVKGKKLKVSCIQNTEITHPAKATKWDNNRPKTVVKSRLEFQARGCTVIIDSDGSDSDGAGVTYIDDGSRYSIETFGEAELLYVSDLEKFFLFCVDREE